MNAVDFFAQHHPYPGLICKELQGVDVVKKSDWENISVHPAHSPGPVAAGEELCRPHTSPIHYEIGKQELKPTAFDDALSFGLSVDRLAQYKVEASLAKAEGRVAASNASRKDNAPVRVVFGYSILDVTELRTVQVKADGSKDEPQRGIAVYDTSLGGEPEHADVCVIVSKSQGQRSARAELFRLGNARHKIVADVPA